MNRTLRLVATALLLVSTATRARAQDAATGVVTGRVIDATGAALAGVRVVATRTATATVRETTTDSTGAHVLTSLAPGEYRVVFEAAGFAPRTFERVVVQVGRRVFVDAVLEVQGRAEAVDVEEAAVSVPTGTSLVGGVVAAGVVENLPLNGRNFLELAFLMPGNAPAPNFDPTKTNVVAISAAGQVGPRRQHHDRRPGQQRRRGGRAARQPAAGRGRGVPDGDRPLLGRAGPLGGGRRQRRDAQRHRHPRRLAERLPARRRASGPARDLRPELRRGASLQPPAVLGDARRADRARQGLVVRGGRVPQPGRGDPDRRARHRHARDPPDALAAAPLDDFLGMARIDVRATDKDTLGLRYLVQDEEDIAASKLDRSIGSDSQRQQSENRHHQALVTWTRTLGSSAVNTLRASYSDFQNDDRPDRPRPPAHLPEHPGRGQLPGAAGDHAEALSGHRLGVVGEGRPHAARGWRVLPHLRRASTWVSSATAASSWCRTSRSST